MEKFIFYRTPVLHALREQDTKFFWTLPHDKDGKKMSDELETKNKVREVPKVRKSSTPTKVTSAIAPKRKKAETTEVSQARPKLSSSSKTSILVVLSFLIGCLLTFAVLSNSSKSESASGSTPVFTEIIAGKVALTESELIEAVKKLGVDAYWAGPVAGAKYTLAVPADGQAYIRYLPNGQGLEDTNPNYVVIATYTTTDAFTATQAAGNSSSGVTFINADGAAVYYNKDTPTNVYVAYPNQNYQIEVFNPISATALEIASKQGALRLVK